MKRNFCVRAGNQKMFFVFAVIFLIMTACNSTGEKKLTAKNTINSDTTFMNVSETHFPEATGADVFKANCLTCHSARYIEMQPSFPAKTWEKIVDKMVKNFGAPIPDSTAKTIAGYITIIKGEK